MSYAYEFVIVYDRDSPRVGSAISERGVIRNTYARNKLHCHFFAKDKRSKKYFFAVTNHDN